MNKPWGISFALLGCVGFTGCAGDVGPALTASPSHAPLSGYVDVTFTGDVASLGDLSSVTLGGVPAYHLRATATSLTVSVQGAPRPGPVELIIEGARGRAVRHNALTYDAPASGMPLVWAAFGASLSQGTQSDGIDEHTQTTGISARLARAANVYLPLPVFADGFAPPLAPTDFNSDCTQKPNTGLKLQQLLDFITDPSTGLFDLKRARASWQTESRNFAIGGAKVAETMHGGSGAVGLLEHVVEDPTSDPGDVIGPVNPSQLERLELLDPDVAFSTDLLANDLDGAVSESDDLHFDKITDLTIIKPLLVEMMARLGKLHGQYFIANMPSFSFLPNVVAVKQTRLAAGSDTEASYQAKIDQLDQITSDYNAALADAMRPYANLHLVDFKAKVDEIKVQGQVVGGERLTVEKFGGLLSFDDLHFSDTGYALYANLFVQVLNDVLHTSLPVVDLEAVHATDEASPARLRALGLTCVPTQ